MARRPRLLPSAVRRAGNLEVTGTRTDWRPRWPLVGPIAEMVPVRPAPPRAREASQGGVGRAASPVTAALRRACPGAGRHERSAEAVCPLPGGYHPLPPPRS